MMADGTEIINEVLTEIWGILMDDELRMDDASLSQELTKPRSTCI